MTLFGVTIDHPLLLPPRHFRHRITLFIQSDIFSIRMQYNIQEIKCSSLWAPRCFKFEQEFRWNSTEFLRFSFLGSCVQAIRDHATDSNRSSRHEKGLNRKLDMHRESERRGEAAPLRRNSSRIRESKGVVSSLDFHDDWNQQRRISLSLRGQYQSEREIESEEKSKGRNRLTWPTAAYTYRLYPSPDLLWFDFIRQTGATRERRSEPLSPRAAAVTREKTMETGSSLVAD